MILFGYRHEPGCGKLTFHVIISIEAWGWDEQSCMHIRFGPPLGNWKDDCGAFQPRYDLHVILIVVI